MYDRKKIMSKAWSLYRTFAKYVNPKSFADCLRQAWDEAKAVVKADADFERKLEVGAIKVVNGCRVSIRRAPIAMAGSMGYYLTGETFYARKAIKAAGFEWDAEARAWFTLDRQTAIKFMA